MEEQKPPFENEPESGNNPKPEQSSESTNEPNTSEVEHKASASNEATQEDETEESASQMVPEPQHVDTSSVANMAFKIRQEVAKVVVGQTEMLDLLLAGILTGGHVLLEGYPGIAKTLSAKMLAKTISADFSRIQFTPDLMPTDITGTSVFNMKESAFDFRPGPIFSNIILIDEINRAPAKTQAALMEVMEEKQITYDGKQYDLGFPFFVIATQNPVEQEGTYQLPEAQLDRFVFRIRVPYPKLEEEKQILKRFQSDFSTKQQEEVNAVITKEALAEVRDKIEQVYIKEDLLDYIATIVDNTRNNGDLFLGGSPRASLAIMRTSKALAAIQGRGFVTPDDIRHVCYPVLNHRLILSHEREMEGTTVEDVIGEILHQIEVPR